MLRFEPCASQPFITISAALSKSLSQFLQPTLQRMTTVAIGPKTVNGDTFTKYVNIGAIDIEFLCRVVWRQSPTLSADASCVLLCSFPAPPLSLSSLFD